MEDEMSKQRRSLKRKLAGEFTRAMTPFFEMLDVDDAKRKQIAKDVVNKAEEEAKGPSDAALKKAFKARLEVEVGAMNELVGTAFAIASHHHHTAPAVQDMRAPEQPRTFSLPSSKGFPTC
jgi:hypothetical protein